MPVNGSFGHKMGDQLLCAIAERLQKSLKSGEFLARTSEDEFCFPKSIVGAT
jgi:GGDEF domain-containing protein